jgi:hypothetical protein
VKGPPEPTGKDSGKGILRVDKQEQMVNFLGTPVRLGPTRHFFTEMKIVSQTPVADGGIEFIIEGSENTKQTSTLVNE